MGSSSSAAAATGSEAGAGGFAVTRWSQVLKAGADDDAEARRALSWLCEAYWQPLLQQVRRRGVDADEAQDVVQEFFARVIEKRDLRADASRGRFRHYLIGAIGHFLANYRDRQRARKRGGDATFEPLAVAQPTTPEAEPEAGFTRAWALTLLERVLQRLASEHASPRQAALFAGLRDILGGAAPAYAELSQRLGVSEGALKVAVHRLRARYRELVRLEVAETVADARDVDAELSELVAALRR